MSDYATMQPSLGYPPIGAVVADTDSYITSNAKLGTIIQAWDATYGAGEFIYLQGVVGTGLGSCVTYNADDWSTTLTVANAKGPVAVAMAATVADTAGWYQIGGKAVAQVAALFADDADCYLTATPGVIDDAIVAGDYITGMKGASAVGTPAAGLAEVELSRPFVTDGL